MNETIVKTLYRGTSEKEMKEMFESHFNLITWWTDNITDLEHYYEGANVKIEIVLETEDEVYYRDSAFNTPKDYTFGVQQCSIPYSTWYSIGCDYLNNQINKIEEIFPVFNEQKII